jgi:hypothetical protein
MRLTFFPRGVTIQASDQLINYFRNNASEFLDEDNQKKGVSIYDEVVIDYDVKTNTIIIK